MKLNTVYDKVKTGYVVATTTDIDDWKRFGGEALGLHMDVRGPDLLSFRVDDRERRLIIRKGETNDIATIGLEIANEDALETILSRLKERSVDVTEVAGKEADIRGVDRFWKLVGPKKIAVEMFLTARTIATAPEIKPSGFKVDEGGLCHLAITSREPASMLGFWREIFDARTSDQIVEKVPGVELLITFTRFNERHHSIAVAETKGMKMDPMPARIHHMALEVADVHDVIGAYERCRALGYKISMSIGRHTNDHAISFYVQSPSGFDVEFSCDGIRVNDALEDFPEGKVHHGISEWGHLPEGRGIRDEIAQLRRGVSSLFRPEYKVF
ncbi:VOC family protein [Lutimaribacter marinistellae]|uniref:VOC family protein n=1 Tax=Lutimaribacter marinistellae TaxID=1820329 RepID=A0ABV7TFD8_9RHOB